MAEGLMGLELFLDLCLGNYIIFGLSEDKGLLLAWVILARSVAMVFAAPSHRSEEECQGLLCRWNCLSQRPWHASRRRARQAVL